MANIIDRRNSSGKKSSAGNRQRFLNKYKKHIRRQVDNIASDKSISDINKDRKIKIKNEDISEPTFSEDLSRGKHKYVHTGNSTKQKGDKILRPPQDDGRGTEGSEEGGTFDEFTFTLTKDEFMDLYFSDMELPDFIKESLKGSTKTKWQRAGYTKQGVPARLDLKKTLKQSIARRKATGSKLFLTDYDLRYRHFTKVQFPIREAVMFCLMDVSGSMDEELKTLAKKFFLLLYLFLDKNYDNITLRFIRHAETADEVDEKEFFYGTKSGGTIVSSGLKLINDIIDKEVDLSKTNIYVAQASDGDNFPYDNNPTLHALRELLDKVQYMTYIQVRDRGDGWKTLLDLYQEVSYKNFNCAEVFDDKDIYPALRELFSRN